MIMNSKTHYQKIIKLLKPDFVIDLHGSSSSRPYDIDFGTMGNISYLNKKDVFLNMIKIFKENGLTILSQDCLAASKNQTDTKWLHHLGVPCVQLEINSNYLMRPQYDTSGIGPIYKQKGSQVLQALMEFTKDFN
jgi:hypothetical protein